MIRELTVKQMAEREGVRERTVRRWIEKGALEVRRTPGGGVRIIERRSVLILDGTNVDNRGHSST
jgi:excisionase family DNA binding protein